MNGKKGFYILIIGVIAFMAILVLTFGSSIGVLFVGANLIYLLLLNWLYHTTKIRNRIKLIFRVMLILYLLFLISFSVIVVLILSHPLENDAELTGIDYVIVLGAGLKADGSLSQTLQQRVDTAYAFVRQHPDTKLVLSGGIGEDAQLSEAEAMGRYLIELGIDPNRLIYETVATTTEENIAFSIKLLDHKVKDPKLLIVTSDYHLFRALYIATMQGFETYGLAASTPLFVRINYIIREYFALLKLVIS